MWRDGWRIGVSAAMLPFCAALAAKAADERRAADAIAEKFANADKAPASPPPTSLPAATPARPDIDYEMDLLRRARAEAEVRSGAAPHEAANNMTGASKPNPAEADAARTNSARQTPPTLKPAKPEVAAAPAPVSTAAPIVAPAATHRDLGGVAPTNAPVARAPVVVRPSQNAATVFRIQIRKPDAAKPAALIADSTKPNSAGPHEAPKPLQAHAPPPAETPAPTSPPLAQPSPPPAHTAAPARATTTAKTEPAQSSAQPFAGRETSGARATILVVLDGGTDTPPDPILCLGDACAISAGLSAPARMLPRAEALALKNTRDATIDPCFGKAACAFRDVPLAADAILQIVLIGSGKMPRAGDGFSIALDTTCKVSAGNVECGRPLETSEFVAWIVPETMAKEAGAPALEAAIADGLPSSEVAQTTDK